MTAIQEISDRAHRDSLAWFPALYANSDDYLIGYFCIALFGEGGEAANLIKKHIRDGKDVAEDLRDELADVFIYLLHLARVAGVDLEEAWRIKRCELIERWGDPDDVERAP